jgi:hypothetical protein
MVPMYFCIHEEYTKIHVSAVKTQWKHFKTLAKQCISYIKYG